MQKIYIPELSARGAGQMDYIVRKTNMNYDLTFHIQKQLRGT